jgi:hypothetical protein
MRTFGEWEVLAGARAEIRSHFGTRITRVARRLLVSGGGHTWRRF